MKHGMIFALILAILMMGLSAYAVPVKTAENAVSVPAVNVSDGSAATLESSNFHILGKYEDGSLLVYANRKFLKVNGQALASLIASLGADVIIPEVEGTEPLSRGSNSAAVTQLQELLIKLGYLTGTADGDFGRATERAVIAEQAALGIEQTGIANEEFQLLLLSLTQPTHDLQSRPISADPFAAISDKTDADLDGLSELGMMLKYDDIDGVGMIVGPATVSYKVPTANDIDVRDFNARFGLRVADGADGKVTLTPVIEMTCTGVQRPIMQKLTLKSGSERHTLEAGSLQNSLKGLDAVETASFEMDDATVAMLAKAVENGELKIRIACMYDNYDITVSAQQLDGIAAIAQGIQSLNP